MRDGPELERLTTEAMDLRWTDELAAVVRRRLEALTGEADWRDAADAARRDLERYGRNAELAREMIRHIAHDLSTEDTGARSSGSDPRAARCRGSRNRLEQRVEQRVAALGGRPGEPFTYLLAEVAMS